MSRPCLPWVIRRLLWIATGKAGDETIRKQQAGRQVGHVLHASFQSVGPCPRATLWNLCGQGSLWERPCLARALLAPSEARRRLTRAKPQLLFALEAATRATRLAGARKLKLHKTGNGA